MKTPSILSLAVLAGSLVVTGLTANPAHAATPTTITASTQITGRDDSGFATQPTNSSNDWAKDAMTRTVTVTLIGTHSGSECGTGWTACYQFTGTVADTNGTFTTDAGAVSPNAGAALVNPPVTGSFTGGAPDFTFYADSNSLSASGVPNTSTGDGPVGTSSWVTLVFPAGTHFSSDLLPNWSWTYKTACETWTDAYNVTQANSGDITGKTCPATVPSGPGDVLNKYLNGLDVFRQADTYNNRIIVFPVKSGDPAVQFDVVPVGKGSFAFEYSPRGVDTGYCVSEAVGSEPSGSAKTGLVLRPCFTPWEAFKIKDAGNGSLQLVNVATGDVIQPNGTKSQFTGVKASVAAGSYFGWNTPGVVPAS